MHAFVYTALPSKVLFGFGTLDKVADEVRMLGCRRALVLSTPQQVAQAEISPRSSETSQSGPSRKRPCTHRWP